MRRLAVRGDASNDPSSVGVGGALEGLVAGGACAARSGPGGATSGAGNDDSLRAVLSVACAAPNSQEVNSQCGTMVISQGAFNISRPEINPSVDSASPAVDLSEQLAQIARNLERQRAQLEDDARQHEEDKALRQRYNAGSMAFVAKLRSSLQDPLRDLGAGCPSSAPSRGDVGPDEVNKGPCLDALARHDGGSEPLFNQRGVNGSPGGSPGCGNT